MFYNINIHGCYNKLYTLNNLNNIYNNNIQYDKYTLEQNSFNLQKNKLVLYNYNDNYKHTYNQAQAIPSTNPKYTYNNLNKKNMKVYMYNNKNISNSDYKDKKEYLHIHKIALQNYTYQDNKHTASDIH